MSAEVMPALKVPKSLTRKLRGLRRRLLRWIVVDGLSRVLLVTLAVVAVDLAIDWHLRMDRAQRAIMLLLGSGAIAYTAWRYLLRPLMTRLSDESLCLEIEARHQGLSEKLISALEFARIDWSRHPDVAPGMVRATIEEGAAASEDVDLSRVLRESRFRANMVLLTLLLFLALGAAFASSTHATMQTWFQRNVLLGDASWPQDFHFRVAGAEGQTLRIPRGDDWSLLVSIDEGYRYLPESAKIEIRAGSGSRIESMDREENGQSFRYPLFAVTETFDFRVMSDKVRTDWYAVRLVERPKIGEVALQATPPDYTGVERMVLPPGQSPYYLLRGSSLAVAGQADKPLSRASLQSGDQEWPLEINENRFYGSVPAMALESGTFVLDVRDRETMRLPGEDEVTGLGVRDPLRFKVRLKADEAPKVQASFHGVSGMVVPRARLPYTASISDDFLLTEVWIDWQWREDKSEGEDNTGSLNPETDLPRAEVDPRGHIDLEPMGIPAGSRLGFQFKARDNNVLTGPGEGASSTLIVRVVSESELRDDLLRREKDQRQLFAGLVDEQDTLLTECQALHAETRGLETLDNEQRGTVVQLQKRQKLLGNGLKPVFERFAGMIDEIRNNRLEDDDGVLQRRMRDRIVDPMTAIYVNQLPLAADSLEAVRRANSGMERRQAFDVAIGHQEQALAIMREILLHMVKSEGYQQAVNLLYDIQKSQEDLRGRTEEEKRGFLEKVLKETEPEPEGNEAPESPETPTAPANDPPDSAPFEPNLSEPE